jgi:hypothetical protein
VTEAGANRLAALRRRGESLTDPVIRLAKEARDQGSMSNALACTEMDVVKGGGSWGGRRPDGNERAKMVVVTNPI